MQCLRSCCLRARSTVIRAVSLSLLKLLYLVLPQNPNQGTGNFLIKPAVGFKKNLLQLLKNFPPSCIKHNRVLNQRPEMLIHHKWHHPTDRDCNRSSNRYLITQRWLRRSSSKKLRKTSPKTTSTRWLRAQPSTRKKDKESCYVKFGWRQKKTK